MSLKRVDVFKFVCCAFLLANIMCVSMGSPISSGDANKVHVYIGSLIAGLPSVPGSDFTLMVMGGMKIGMIAMGKASSLANAGTRV